MRILFATPGYWPSTAYGGPISKMRELARGLVERGHAVDVVTTSLTDLDRRPPRTTRSEQVDGATIHYLGTPFRYRWMGVTPSIRRRLRELQRPDVVHVFGFRDFVGTMTARWARDQEIPYVFEGLGMVQPKRRKVALKHALDATVYRSVLPAAALLIATSERERDEYDAVGIEAARIVVRPNGFPARVEQVERPGPLRERLGLDPSVPLVLSIGRVVQGKGIELLVRSLPGLDGVQLAVVGPGDPRGTAGELAELARRLGVEDRVHLTGPWPSDGPPLGLYGDADVCALVSEDESFGMVAAEAAAAGCVPLVTDRCGIAELLRDSAGVVVPYDQMAVQEGLVRLLGDAGLRRRLGEGARAVAADWSWPRVVGIQEDLYHRALDRG